MQPADRKTPWLVYTACALAVIAAASTGGLFRPDAWFAALAKPSWNPPNWLFAPVWTALYVMIAIAGGRVFAAADSGLVPARVFWIVQLVLNGLWTFLFFSLHQIDLALLDIVALLVEIAGFITVTWNRDRPAALLFVPYMAWVGFATALNAALWLLNRA